MDKLLFWLGIGAAQKGAGSKAIKRRKSVRSSVIPSQATQALLGHGQVNNGKPAHTDKKDDALPRAISNKPAMANVTGAAYGMGLCCNTPSQS
jgi:hypothetical protein